MLHDTHSFSLKKLATCCAAAFAIALTLPVPALASASSQSGTAYASLSADGSTLTFYRSSSSASGGTGGSSSAGKAASPSAATYSGFEETTSSTASPFASADKVTSIVFEDSISPACTADWFKGFSNLNSVEGLSNLNTSKVTDFSSMFEGCTSLSSIDISSLDMSKAADTSDMFAGDSSLSTITMGKTFTAKNAKSSANMFPVVSADSSHTGRWCLSDGSNGLTADSLDASYAGSSMSGTWIREQFVPVYRLYNKWTGDHFFTESLSEDKSLEKVGWKDEGMTWKSAAISTYPVYRLYNPYSGDHHFTTSLSEYSSLAGIGWIQEGQAFYSIGSRQDVDWTEPVYRLYNRWLKVGSHLFTTNEDEQGYLQGIGWNFEGVAFYAFQ